MKHYKLLFVVLIVSLIISGLASCKGKKAENGTQPQDKSSNLNIGWAWADITPDGPVLLRGQFPARVSEGVLDSIKATVLAIESGKGPSSKKVIMISCDLLNISDFNDSKPGNNLLEIVRNRIKESLPEIGPDQVILNATHTHTAPFCSSDAHSKNMYGIELDAMSPSDCQKYISERIAKAAAQAWKNRKPGGISFGLGQAVVGHNRVQVDFSGKSLMLGNTNKPEFSHIEGFEDHSVNLLYTWNKDSKLTGVVINIACPSQVTSKMFKISSDLWHDIRAELGQRLGKDVYILPQCSAAGDQCPILMVGDKAEKRMESITLRDSSLGTGPESMGQRKYLALRVTDAVTSVLPYMKENIVWNPAFDHRMKIVNLSRIKIGTNDVKLALTQAKEWKLTYEKLLLDIEKNPDIKKNKYWYLNVTDAYRRMKRFDAIKERYDMQKSQPGMPFEIHVVRIGDVVFATNPFELYMDFGIRIKARSPAIQTFLVQLSGSGTYLPTARSLAGGAYGADFASNLVGPEGGQELVENTLEIINEIW